MSNPGITCFTTDDNQGSSGGAGISYSPSGATENFSLRFWIVDPPQQALLP